MPTPASIRRALGAPTIQYPNSWQPMGYAAIGVSGAAPGSAYESYYISTDVGKAYQTNPSANGLLAADQNGNYNFHAGNNVQFEVYPNNPEAGASLVRTSLPTGETSTWFNPPGPEPNGFWLLTLDRVTLLPVDFNQGLCGVGGSANCGQFFPTGSTDPNVAAQAASALGLALIQPTNRQLIVLTTLGQPFQSGTNGAGYAGVVQLLGGSGYTLPTLTTSTSTYTLISPGFQPAQLPLKLFTPFSKGVVNSSSAFSQQGQTGIVRGVMAPDNSSLYFPTVVSQEDGKMNGDGASSVSIDYDFYTISSQPRVDWALTDTPGHMAAYHWASQRFLDYHYGTSNPPDPLSADVRYWYSSPTRNSDMATHNTDFLCPNTVTNSPCNYPGDGLGFTEQDLADVDTELYNEVTWLHDSDLYLGAQRDREPDQRPKLVIGRGDRCNLRGAERADGCTDGHCRKRLIV